jgi:lysophospholipase L1-like esterase
VVLGLAVLVLAAATLEVAARIHDPLATADHVSAVPLHLGRFDERLGWALVPGAKGRSVVTGELVEYEINSHGLRGPERSIEKPDGVLRVVLLGDSRTFGYGNSLERHFSTLLEQSFEGVEVVNLGVSGYGVDQELLALRDPGLRFEPDLVVCYVAHYGDERHMHASRFGGAKPRFELRDGELVLTRAVVPAPPDGGWRETARELHRTLRRTSAAYALVRELLVGRLTGSPVLGAGGSPSTATAGDGKGARDPEFLQQMHALGAAIVLAMRDEATDHGARFALVTQVRELHAAATAAGVHSLDLADELLDSRFALSPTLAHLNDAGNALLAEHLAAFLVERGLLPAERWVR